MMEVDVGEAEMDAHQGYLHVGRMHVRRRDGFGRVAGVDQVCVPKI
jgi:hypothetical protein